MLTLLYWLYYKYVVKLETANNLWLREQMKENYIFVRTVCWILDLMLALWVTLMIIRHQL